MIKWENMELDGNDSKFLTLGNSTQVRIGSDVKYQPTHIEKTMMGNKKRVNCPSEGCPLCKAGKAIVKRYVFKVINRAGGQAYILEVGAMVMKEILKYAKNPNYGSVDTYDIKIIKTGVGLDTRYSVMASPKKSQLTDSEIQALAEIDIDHYVKANSIEEIYNLGFEGIYIPPINCDPNDDNFNDKWD
jgi:hypothetical protein